MVKHYRHVILTPLLVACVVFSHTIAADDSSIVFGNTHRFLERFDEVEAGFSACEPEDFIENLNVIDALTADSVPIGQADGLRVISPQTIIELLQQIGFITTLEEEQLYLHTNILNSRNILDYPIFEPNRCCYEYGLTLGGHIFYNHMQRCHFTDKSTDIRSYFAIDNESLINRLENNIAAIKELFADAQFNLDIAKVAGILGNMTVQERRAGFMFHLGHIGTRSEIRVMWPFYWRERNFFLRDNEKQILEEEFGALEKRAQEQFQRDHFISDQLGFGDIRFEGAFRVYWNERATIRVGWLATIPASFAVVKNIKGSSFPKCSNEPAFDFDRLFDLACVMPITPEVQEEAFNMIKNFFLGAVDRLAAQLLDVDLGNEGHPGFGILLRNTTRIAAFIKHPWAENFMFRTRGSFEYLFAAHERRMYIKVNDTAGFKVRDFDNPDMAQENLAFLGQQFTNKFYLIGFDTKIQPGCIFRWTSKLCYEGDPWGFYFGSEWWVQGRERIQVIDAPLSTIVTLDVPKERIPFPYQNRIFGGVSYRFDREHCNVYVSLNGDGSTISSGIGHDYIFSLNVEVNF